MGDLRRTITRMQRLRRIATALALALLAAPALTALEGALLEREARAEAEDDLAVGTELMAVSDLSLHRAEIAKGARVNVTKLYLRDGRLDSVNVALADGHVVKMPLGAVRTYFRVVTE